MLAGLLGWRVELTPACAIIIAGAADSKRYTEAVGSVTGGFSTCGPLSYGTVDLSAGRNVRVFQLTAGARRRIEKEGREVFLVLPLRVTTTTSYQCVSAGQTGFSDGSSGF